MAKRRVNAESTRRRNRVESPSTKSDSSVSGDRHSHLFFIAVVSAAVGVLIYRHIKHSPPTPDVYHRKLVKADITSEEILAENSRVLENDTRRHFPNRVLAYVTPWNSAGYDIAKRFNSKFTHISPVWYELKSVGAKYVLEGRHNADVGWLSELRLRGSVQVLPRIVLEVPPQDMLTKKKHRDKVIDLIVTECKDMDYDGVVLESWSRWSAYGVVHDAPMRKMVLQFLKQLGEALHKINSHRSGERLQLVYVIGPPELEKLEAHDFGPQDLQFLSESVDGFSLMTYDFSSPYHPGPNAPLKWIYSILEILLGKASKSLASKIFVGINFYGNDFIITEGGGGGTITGRDYLAVLDQYKPKIEWQNSFSEHFFMYIDDKDLQHVVFYPTLMSVSQRLQEARSWGAGISIWEIGQGLEYFYDLL